MSPPSFDEINRMLIRLSKGPWRIHEDGNRCTLIIKNQDRIVGAGQFNNKHDAEFLYQAPKLIKDLMENVKPNLVDGRELIRIINRQLGACHAVFESEYTRGYMSALQDIKAILEREEE